MKQIYTFAFLLLFVALAASAQTEKQLILLQTSDTHSRLAPVASAAADKYAGMGGAVRRATFLKQFRSEHPDALLFDCGDISQGTPYYNLFQGEVEIQMMNLMKYDAMVIGNHEFDFGLDNMARLFRMASFPILSANYEVSGTVLEGLVKPYIVLVRQGVRIGVFGISPAMAGLVQADMCQGIVFRDPVATAQQTTDVLRQKENCDVVICLSHLGYTLDENLMSQTKNIDIVLGGHSHTFMEKPMEFQNAEGKSVNVFHTGKNGVYVGKSVLTLTTQ